MIATRSGFGALLCAALAWSPGAHAQSSDPFDLSAFDPAAAALLAEDVLFRAPDADIDRLFQAVHATSRNPDEARVMCALFEPGAARSPAAWQRAANALGQTNRQRLADALAMIAISGLQGTRQSYDAAAAQQVVKSAGAKAMFLHEGFTAGMAATGDDDAGRDARCRSFGWLVDALGDFPLADRAAATRYLLGEGLALYRDTG